VGSLVKRAVEIESEKGAAAVEFALVSVLLLTLLFGIIQYAYFFFQSQGASSTAREAARLAAVGVSSCPTFEAAVLGRASGNGTDIADRTLPSADISLAMSNPTSGDPVGVTSVGDVATISITWVPQKFGFPFVPFLNGSITSEAETRVESVTTASVTSC
jgi:Flp pilus assembly protein TadG